MMVIGDHFLFKFFFFLGISMLFGIKWLNWGKCTLKNTCFKHNISGFVFPDLVIYSVSL